MNSDERRQLAREIFIAKAAQTHRNAWSRDADYAELARESFRAADAFLQLAQEEQCTSNP